jgi:8-oxo-dGTP pyrophosphatase MutT (NUDIX family)
MKKAVLALIIPRVGFVTTVLNRRYASWGLPGGKVDPGETDEQALARELLEEISCVPLSYTKIIEEVPSAATGSNHVVDVYHIHRLRGVPTAVEKGTLVQDRFWHNFLAGSRWRDWFLEHLLMAPFKYDVTKREE